MTNSIQPLKTLCLNKIFNFDPQHPIPSDLIKKMFDELRTEKPNDLVKVFFIKAIDFESTHNIYLLDKLTPEMIRILLTKFSTEIVFSTIFHHAENLNLAERIIPHLNLSSTDLIKLMTFCINSSWFKTVEYIFTASLNCPTLFISIMNYLENEGILLDEQLVIQTLLTFLKTTIDKRLESLLRYTKKLFPKVFLQKLVENILPEEPCTLGMTHSSINKKLNILFPSKEELMLSLFPLCQRLIIEEKYEKLSTLFQFMDLENLFFPQNDFEKLLISCKDPEALKSFWIFIPKRYSTLTQNCLDTLFKQACKNYDVYSFQFLLENFSYSHLIPTMLDDLFHSAPDENKEQLELLLYRELLSSKSISTNASVLDEKTIELIKKGIYHSFLKEEPRVLYYLLEFSKKHSFELKPSFFQTIIDQFFLDPIDSETIHECFILLFSFIDEKKIKFHPIILFSFIKNCCLIGNQKILLEIFAYAERNNIEIVKDQVEELFLSLKSSQFPPEKKEAIVQTLTTLFSKTSQKLSNATLKELFFFFLANGFKELFYKTATFCLSREIIFSEDDFQFFKFSKIDLLTISSFIDFLTIKKIPFPKKLFFTILSNSFLDVSKKNEKEQIQQFFFRLKCIMEDGVSILPQNILEVFAFNLLIQTTTSEEVWQTFFNFIIFFNHPLKINIIYSMLKGYNSNSSVVPISFLLDDSCIANRFFFIYFREAKKPLSLNLIKLFFPNFSTDSTGDNNYDFSKFFQLCFFIEKFLYRTNPVEALYKKVHGILTLRIPSLEKVD